MALHFSFSSSTRPFSSSSSSISYSWKYDVFISFRGEDTRYGFTGYLYDALCKKGIHTFIDDEELQKGEEITPSLFSSIQESRIGIIVLSPNYASSSFCLDELVEVLRCIKGNNRLVLPVFYKVHPSDVRHQRNCFREAMAKHKKRFKNDFNKLHKWKEALHQVANLSGYHFKDGVGYEHKLIKNIVEDISRKVRRVPLPVADYPVGLESRVLEVISLLEIESDDAVYMLGIHGIGGIGKTTLALAVFNLIADHFECVCFLENMRENSNKYGLVHLQNILLRKMLGKEGVQIDGVKEGTSQIKQRLCRKRVLLILDDVDEQEQLKSIAGKPDWFGGGSRVIITTRDTHLLKLHGVERTYDVQCLNEEESLNLLMWKTFKSDTIIPSYADVLNRAITYASGHPLALELIGSNLFGKEVQVWESALDQFEKHLDHKIHKVFRVSFDALGEQEQIVFLDIACCFKGYTSKELSDLLEAHYGRSMKYHIEVLVQKSLIKINHHYKVTMHDLIEDMGKEIDNLEKSAEMPGKRRRLWYYKDVVKVLEDNQGTSVTEIIYLEVPSFEVKGDEDPFKKEGNKDVAVKWDGAAFKEMKNLKTLIIKNGCFSERPKHLPKSLRVLEWRKYPSEYFPPDFQPEMLCILKLPDYVYPSPKLDSLSKKLVSLKVLKFNGSNSLKEIPDVSSLHSLQELSFKGCRNLVTVDNSVGFLPKLKILNAEDCDKLSYFPPVIQLPSLEALFLSGCSSLEYFPEIQQEIEKVKSLDLSNVGIKDLPCSFRNLSRLRDLYLNGSEMCKMPSVITMMPQLSSCDIKGGGKNKGRVSGKLEEGFQGMLTHLLPSENLTSLFLENTNLSDEFFPLAVAWFPNVEWLDLRGNNFTSLPECIQQFRFLRKLTVNDCTHLREIRGIPPNLEYFSAVNCKSLSPRTKRLLLNQGWYEDRSTTFLIPGERIPRWFEQRCSGGTCIYFWFRGTIFPAKSLCVAFLLNDHIPSLSRVRILLSINGKLVSFKGFEMEQLLILNMNSLSNWCASFPEEGWNRALPECEEGWNLADVSFVAYDKDNEEIPSESTAEEIGMHVVKQMDSSIIQDIRFTCPYIMTELIIMMMMVLIVLPNHKKQPLLLETCIGLWTLLFLTHWFLWEAQENSLSHDWED